MSTSVPFRINIITVVSKCDMNHLCLRILVIDDKFDDIFDLIVEFYQV